MATESASPPVRSAAQYSSPCSRASGRLLMLGLRAGSDDSRRADAAPDRPDGLPAAIELGGPAAVGGEAAVTANLKAVNDEIFSAFRAFED